MAGKRKDLNRRNLPSGVSQKKDGSYKGRYCYTYQGLDGKRHCVYSYRLYETDPVPKGKKENSCIPLMTTIAQIERDKQDGIISAARDVTLNDLFEKYMGMRPGIKSTTRICNLNVWERYIRDSLGGKEVAKISYSDIKSFYLYLLWEKPNQQTGEKGLSLLTVQSVHALICSVLNLAKKDKIIRDNPSEGVFEEIKSESRSRLEKDNKQVKSLTASQQKNFLLYVKNHIAYVKWYNLFIVLFGTGMRIGELCALRRDDLDFEKDIIHINFTLHYYKGVNDTKHNFHMSTPKTSAAKRNIPMFPEVKEALLRQLEVQLKIGNNKAVVDGYSGFVFQTSRGNPMLYTEVDDEITLIVSNYNKEEGIRAERENRKEEYLPYFSAHDIRHTFATRMAENNANQLVMKKVMGHTSISTTLDIYAEVMDTEERECFDDLEGNMSLS